MQIIWLKRDLRLQDHEPLRRALEVSATHGPVLHLYIHEPSLIAQPDCAAQHSAFIRETLAELHAELARFGGSLVERIGEAVDILEALWQQTRFERLWAHQETTTLAGFARDRAVQAWCRSKGICFEELEQNAVRRGPVFKKEGFRYREHLDESCAATFFVPRQGMALARTALESCDPKDVPQGMGHDKPGRLKGGRAEAECHLTEFVRVEKLREYPSAISSPNTAPTGCSRLSPYLAYGVMSDREIFQRLNNTVNVIAPTLPATQGQKLKDAVQFYADRIYWRSAYLQSMESKPRSEIENDLAAFNGVRESEFDPEWLAAWQEGRTGYPMVDAVMAMLRETGWVNMRMRGMVASFAVNELWLPWREVGLHLAQEFLDYEPGIHWNQLNIHSGTSRLSGPLTYNVVKQALDHDPHGTFVRKWLPALRDVPDENIFEPWKMSPGAQVAARCFIGKDYPTPIAAHLAANDAARERVAALREGRPVPNSVYWKTRAQDRARSRQDSLF